jgi:homoserine kinase
MSGRAFTIRVPATSANLGPGFDSLGLALSFWLTVRVDPAVEADGRIAAAEGAAATRGRPGSWRVDLRSETLLGLPTDETNLIVRAALEVAAGYGITLPPGHLVVNSEIPLARGLGSSASAIVAGAVLANELGGLGLSREDIVAVTAAVEGHPDNVAAAVLGGLVVTAGTPGPVFIRANLPPADIVVAIPDYPLSTELARAALPGSLPHPTAVLAGARGNVLVAALLSGDWVRAGLMMRGDLLHEPYRAPLMPTFTRLRDLAYEAGAYGACLSGAGPTVIAFTPPGRGGEVGRAMGAAYPAYDVRITTEDRQGLVVSRED